MFYFIKILSYNKNAQLQNSAQKCGNAQQWLHDMNTHFMNVQETYLVIEFLPHPQDKKL